MAYFSTLSVQCCHCRKRHPSSWVFCLGDGQACPFCGRIAVHCQGCSTKRLTAKWCCCGDCCVPKSPGKGKKQRSHCCPDSSSIGACLVRWRGKAAVGNRCLLHQELVRAPWSFTSLTCVFKAAWVWYGLQGQENRLPELESLLNLGVTSGEGAKWERKVWYPGSCFKAQESMLSLPTLKPWTATGNVFSFVPSTFQPILQWRRKERVKNVHSLELSSQS